MAEKSFSRRDFLRLGALTAAGAALAGCTQPPAGTPVKTEASEPTEAATEASEPTEAPTEEAPPVDEFVLEFLTDLPEYASKYQQIWDLYLAENPHVTLEIVTVTEGAAAEALQAKRAGGWFPSIDMREPEGGETADQHNYQEMVNLLETDFPWFDRWTYDVKTAWANKFGVEGYLPVINHAQAWDAGWVYHKDLVDEAGVNPRDVKTWEDLETLLEKGTAWANSTDEVDFFMDRGMGSWVLTQGAFYFSYAYQQGHPDLMREAIMSGNLSGPDSPVRPGIETYVRWYEKGILPKEWWLREWEADMEASYVAKKSVFLYHGPWIWDKAVAADPSIQQEGIPETPPAADGGPENWIHMRGTPEIDSGHSLDKRVLDMPEYPEIQKAFNWWFSPLIVKLRCEAEGFEPAYKTDEPVDFENPQYQGYLKEFQPGGLYEDVEIVYMDPWGLTDPYLREDGQKWEDWDWPALLRDVMKKDMTIDEFLEFWEEGMKLNYDLPG